MGVEVEEAESDTSEGGARRWIGLAVLSLGVAMIVVDGTIVSVATPTIIQDLDLDLSDAQWLTAIYSLVFAALLITVGRLGDRFGRRLLFVLGLVVFVGASIFAGRAGSGGELFLTRFIQGVGAAMILPSSLSRVNAVFTGRARAYAFAVWGSVIAGMAAVGPVLGGWLTTDHSWRWAFYINVPIGILVIIGTLVFVDATKDENAERGWDPVGIVASVLASGLFVFALIEGETLGWWTPIAPLEIGPFTWPDIGVSAVPVGIRCLRAGRCGVRGE